MNTSESSAIKSAEPAQEQTTNEPIATKFARLVDLRVAKITHIERHPKADKLYIETLDLGGETRTIVSGLVPYYKEEELLGKHIIVVYNLKPAKLRGVESKGMLLAASATQSDGSEVVEVLDASFAEPGTRIQVGNIPLSEAPAEIDIDTFFSMPILAKDGVILIDQQPLTCNGKTLSTNRVLQGEVG